MDTIKVNFGYFWPSFDNNDNYFTRILSKNYKVEISENPQLYFFTHPYNGKRDYLKYKSHRVFLGWENKRANWDIADYVLDSDYVNGNPRHKRYPIWASWRTEQLTIPKNMDLFKAKTKFCCMLVSNPNARERIDFFNCLSKYKQVDSGGKFLNNIDYVVEDKLEFIKDYKFVISFENSSWPGYTTEKLIEPMLSSCVPIYWGNERVGDDFNEESFICVKGRNDFARAIEQLIILDSSQEKYLELASRPWFKDNTVPQEMSESSLEQFFDFVLKDMHAKRPVALNWLKDGHHKFDLLKGRADYYYSALKRKLFN